MASDKGKMKVFMFPWLAHGHISPFLELAKEFSDRNISVYLCSNGVNLDSVRGQLNESRYKGVIKLVELNLPVMKDLPAHCHTTKNLPPHRMPLLKKAFDMLTLQFSALLRIYKPDCLIYDTIQSWAPGIASMYRIPAVAFVSTSATMTSFMIHHHDSSGKAFPFPNIYLHNHEEDNFNHLTKSSENYYNGKNRFTESIKSSSEIVLLKSSREIEGTYIDYLSSQVGKKIVCVGPLVQAPPKQANLIDSDVRMIKWLDKKEPNSTVFVSFGSEYFLTKDEIVEVALGLELSMVNFIWVVRFPKGNNTKVEEVLPKFFLERTKERGIVVQGWAPQVKILKHANTGGFLSHCGWSSVMEAIKYNVPIIAVPMHLDQPVNARLVQEIEVGVEVKKLKNGRLMGEEIALGVREVVLKEAGRAAREKEREMSAKIRRSEDEVLGGVVKELNRLWKKNKNGICNGMLERFGFFRENN